MVNLLQAAIQEGTGRPAAALGEGFAGKTGTTNDFRDALFAGFSPSVAAGVWIGIDDQTPLGPGETGARAALPVWIEFMEEAQGKKSLQYFDLPDTLVKIRMDPATGERLPETATEGVWALFPKGSEPPPEDPAIPGL